MNDFKLFFENIDSSELKNKILSSRFLREIRYMGGRLYFVGGAVRDYHIGKPSKDIDVVVSNIPNKQLVSILEKHGKVDFVGQSFGVIKFIPNEFEVPEPIDIALPRSERPMTAQEKEEYRLKNGRHPSAYQAFTVEPDHDLDIEEELKRRDFTINAIAQDHLGNNIDPHNGIKDIRKRIIRMVSPKNFIEDPLRMLRGVQFASRFGFRIEPKTFDSIRNNSSLISGIPGERILEELKKIVTKGDQLLGAKLLCETNLWQEISSMSCSNHDNQKHLFELSNASKTVSEFLFLMFFNSATYEESFRICKKLKCEALTEKQIKGLFYAWNFHDINHQDNSYKVVFNLNKIHPSCLDLLVLPNEIKEAIKTDMPKSLKDLPVNGRDLMNLGLKEKQISNAFNNIIDNIFNGSLKNSRDSIINFLNQGAIKSPLTRM